MEALDATLTDAPALALLTVAVVEPGALGALQLLGRGLFAGRRWFARLVHAKPGAVPSRSARPRRGVIRSPAPPGRATAAALSSRTA